MRAGKGPNKLNTKSARKMMAAIESWGIPIGFAFLCVLCASAVKVEMVESGNVD